MLRSSHKILMWRSGMINGKTHLLSLKACNVCSWMFLASICPLRCWSIPPPLTPGGWDGGPWPWAKGRFMTFKAAVLARVGRTVSGTSSSCSVQRSLSNSLSLPTSSFLSTLQYDGSHLLPGETDIGGLSLLCTHSHSIQREKWGEVVDQ